MAFEIRSDEDISTLVRKFANSLLRLEDGELVAVLAHLTMIFTKHVNLVRHDVEGLKKELNAL